MISIKAKLEFEAKLNSLDIKNEYGSFLRRKLPNHFLHCYLVFAKHQIIDQEVISALAKRFYECQPESSCDLAYWAWYAEAKEKCIELGRPKDFMFMCEEGHMS